MKPSRILLTLATTLLLYACHNSSSPFVTDEGKPSVPAAKKNYFPVGDFLKSEIAQVDSIPFRLMKYQIRNGKTDSGIINTQAFDLLAREFLLEDLDSNRFEKRFEETSFLDQSTGLLTFTYSTKDTSYGLRRVDVLAIPNLGTDKVKSIYLEVSSGNLDSLVLRKMYWSTGKSFSILKISQPAHGVSSTSQTKVVWNSSE